MHGESQEKLMEQELALFAWVKIITWVHFEWQIAHPEAMGVYNTTQWDAVNQGCVHNLHHTVLQRDNDVDIDCLVDFVFF
jgi:hypothetical protein